MPVYEFKCDPCNSRVDRLLPMQHGVQSCPTCDTEMKKMVTMPAFTPGHWETRRAGSTGGSACT